MPESKRAYINVDELVPQLSLEQVAAYYNVQLPELKRVGAETRSRCFLACGRTLQTGDRALAIQDQHPAKQWKCHQYGCTLSGNLVSLCDLMKPGPNAAGRPRGDRFKQIAADLQAMVAGISVTAVRPPVPEVLPAPKPMPEKHNVPLAESDNERARSLIELDQKFIADPALMPPSAAAYFRRRPFLSPEVCRKWRMGYLPRDVGGGDKSGGTMRGRIVYGYHDESSNILTWFGRDPDFEEKQRLWEATDRTGREPEKFHFVKGFHRGLELYGQHGRQRLQTPGYREQLQKLGLIVVEGPNDVIALDVLGVPAVGLCSNTVTDAQVEKLTKWSNDLAGGVVTLLFDCDEQGDNGAKQALYQLAQRCKVKLGWSSTMFRGQFKGRQPESLVMADCKTIALHDKTMIHLPTT